MYTNKPINKRNKNIKHIGSRDTLKIDINKILSSNKIFLDNQLDLLINTTMHHILVLLAISEESINPKIIHLGN